MGLTLRQSLVAYVLAMILAIAGIAAFVYTAPPLPQAFCSEIVTPMDVVRGQLVREPKKSILDLWGCLREYKKDHWGHTTAGIWGIYVIFKIFGPFGAGTSMVLSVLTGALYDEWAEPNTGYSVLAHLIGVSGEVCGGIGAWLMSYAIGREILLHFAAEKMATLKKEMDKFEGSLFRYMLFLRVSPLFPNWFVNYSTALCHRLHPRHPAGSRHVHRHGRDAARRGRDGARPGEDEQARRDDGRHDGPALDAAHPG
mmetsp:Transcript_59844/g.157340  ORF Transcript_59844/g.157340 Transcript_59844/m.157340 type:complete len:255 (-) Transcript_59844:245-1009(-)